MRKNRVTWEASRPMATAVPPRSRALRAHETLVGRFDPSVIETPRRGARIRLALGDPAAANDGGSSARDAVGSDVLIENDWADLQPIEPARSPDALLTADEPTWIRIAEDIRAAMDAFRQGRLSVRRNLSLGVGLLAATTGSKDPGRLRFARVRTPIGYLSTMEAGAGDPIVLLHGLGGTKASFLPSMNWLADSYRVIAVDLPGFGDSVKPIGARYDARYFAQSVIKLLDRLGIEHAHVVGNSMGGRVALELGMFAPERVDKLVLLAPSLAWLRGRPWAPFLRLLRPELGLLQAAPRPVVEGIVRRIVPGASDGWSAAGVDEFLRAYLDPRGRAAFYAAARQIYLEEPHGDEGFWTRLRSIQGDSLFVWGLEDNLVPISFQRHVREALPLARHVELDCGHVPQVEAPRETHAAIKQFLRSAT